MLRSLIVLFALLASNGAFAQTFLFNIHGIPFSCTAHNGQPVPVFTDPVSAAAAAPLGGARADWVPGSGYRISLNVPMLSSAPPRAAVMVFYHECGHVALPPGVGLNSPMQERNADCWAIQNMVNDGFIQNMTQFQEAVQYVLHIGGLNGFTTSRIAAMRQCLP